MPVMLRAAVWWLIWTKRRVLSGAIFKNGLPSWRFAKKVAQGQKIAVKEKFQ